MIASLVSEKIRAFPALAVSYFRLTIVGKSSTKPSSVVGMLYIFG